ncbi:C-C chemokine receptor type 6a [Osmerus mordax]|uniref:C-C chemokine receptor type 6a n=1 Tax=Osmerus mordax TaxID=8014 RepID=UPI00350F1110
MNSAEDYKLDYGDYYRNDIEEPCEMINHHKVERALKPYVHSVICILGFIGNVLVIITYAFYKKSKSMTDVYLLNMAIADLLFVVALPLIIYNEYSDWSMGTDVCKMLRGAYSVNLYSGMLLLACISTDRFIAIVMARRSFRLRSRALLYSRIVCALVWGLAFFLSIPTFLYYERYIPSHSNTSFEIHGVFLFNETSEDDSTVSPVCEFRFPDIETADKMKVLIPSTQMAIGFFLPLLIMGFCYTSIIITLLRVRGFQRHKAVRVVLAVVVVFIACHLPYNIALLYDTITMFHLQDCKDVDLLHTIKAVTESVAYLHCCLNPVLYAFVGVKFRNHFRKIVEDLWCLGKKYIQPRRFSRVTSEMYVSSTRRSMDASSTDASSFTM